MKDLDKLNRQELLDLQKKISKQLKKIEDVKLERIAKISMLKNVSDKDEVFCIRSYNGKTNFVGRIKFKFEDTPENGSHRCQLEYTNGDFIMSSWILDDELTGHCHMWENAKSIYFITLRPKQWKEDFYEALDNLIAARRNYFKKTLDQIRKLSENTIDSTTSQINQD